MRTGRNVKRYVRQGPVSPWEVGLPDETRAVLGSVRAVRDDGGSDSKSPYAGSDAGNRADAASDGEGPVSHTDTHFTPDGADGTSNRAGFGRQGYPFHPDRGLTGCLPWDDDRGWIALWRDSSPRLADREPVLRAWLEAAPPQPLPRSLPALELARIARNYGINVRVTP